MRHASVVLTLLTGTLLLSSASFAGDPDSSVARVSYVGGDVSYQRGDLEGWNSLRVNTPLVTGDSFYAPDGGRAEVDLGNGMVVRVDGGTQVDLLNLTRDVAQLGINSGSLDLSAHAFPRGFTLEIDTPSGAATLHEPGRYRVEVTDRTATYAVVQGSMSLALDGQQLDVREGESLQLENNDPPTYGYGRISGGTPFQSWADQRDVRFDRSPSARYVNANVVGYEDLDDHGTWRDNSQYGRVWVPSGMSQGWAPYQSGRWIWQDPYGWTWVSDESWGWAPYHYGRWVRAGNEWGWVPPPPRGYRGPSVVMNIDAVYAPALVAFVGGRNWGLSLSIGGPAIGWVPLAPAERYYYPWQSAPPVTNNYTNITVINAVTVVNYSTFAAGPVHPVHVERAQLERAPVMGYTAVGVVPVRGSLIVASEINPGRAAAPAVRADRPMVTRLVPPPRPEPFTQKVVQIERTGLPVATPVAREAAVGKPFVPGVKAPAGVSAVSALAPAGKKDLTPRAGADARPPKKIERDIAPPPPSRPNPADSPSPAAMPAPAVPPPPATPRNDQKNNQKPNQNQKGKNAPAPAVAPQPPPQPQPQPQPQPRQVPPPVSQPPHADPAPTPPPVDAHGKPPQAAPKHNQNQNQGQKGANAPAPPPAQAPTPPPVEKQAPKAVVPPPPTPPDATPSKDAQKKNQKAKGKKTPEPPPPPPPPDPPAEPPPGPANDGGV